jgi:RNA polymerase sigma-70 factor (ECF subfamily)
MLLTPLISAGQLSNPDFRATSSSSCRDDQPLAGFEELAMPLFDSLYNFSRWLPQNSNDAEDLVQETYLKALRSFASFQSGTNFRAWIFKILKNTFLSPSRELPSGLWRGAT